MGFTKWGTVIFSDLVSKGRLARPGWQGQVGKARLARPGWQDQVGKVGLSRLEVIKQEELEK